MQEHLPEGPTQQLPSLVPGVRGGRGSAPPSARESGTDFLEDSYHTHESVSLSCPLGEPPAHFPRLSASGRGQGPGGLGAAAVGLGSPGLGGGELGTPPLLCKLLAPQGLEREPWGQTEPGLFA